MRSFWEIDIKDLYSASLKQAAEDARSFFDKMGQGEKETKEHVEHTTHAMHEQKGMLDDLREAAAEFFAAEKLFEVGKDWIADGAKMETTRIQFQGLTGDIEKGNYAFEELTNLYKDFSFLEKGNIMEAGQQLEKVKFPIDRLKKEIYEFGSLSLGDGSKMSELATIYSRAFASGFVNTRMLLSQPALLQEIEQMVGKNSVAFRKYAATGQVSIQILDEAMEKLTSKGGQFGGMMERMNDSVSGHWNHLKMEMAEEGEKMFEDLKPFLNGLMKTGEYGMPKLEAAFKGIVDIGKEAYKIYSDNENVFKGIAAMGGVILGVFTAIELKTLAMEAAVWLEEGAINACVEAMWMLDVAVDANPFGAILGTLGAMGVAILALSTDWGDVDAGAKKYKDTLDGINHEKDYVANLEFAKEMDKNRQAEEYKKLYAQGLGMYEFRKRADAIDGDNLFQNQIKNEEKQWRLGKDNERAQLLKDKEWQFSVRGVSKDNNEFSYGDNKTEPSEKTKQYGNTTPFGDATGNQSTATGGAQGKNIIIHINKIVGIEHLQTNNIYETEAQLEARMEKIMLAIVNDVSVAA